MKNLTLITLLIIGPIFFSSCKKTVDYKDIEFRDGKAFQKNSYDPITGLVVDYYENEDKSLKSEVEFTGGQFDGEMKFYYENGQKQWEAKFAKNTCVENNEWFDNGQKSNEEIYTKGRLKHKKTYYTNGSVRFTIDNIYR